MKNQISNIMCLQLLLFISLFAIVKTPAQSNPNKINCDDEEAVMVEGPAGPIVAFPPDRDTSEPPVYEDVNENRGYVKDLYPGYATDTDTWYRNIPCNVSIGGIEPDEEEIQNMLGTQIPNLDTQINEWETHIFNNLPGIKPQLTLAGSGPLALPYTKPAQAFSPKKERMIFGGRDLVFVHGLKLDHLTDTMSGVPGAQKRWLGVNPGQPGNITNPEYYNENGYQGYYYQKALKTWDAHIKKFLTNRGIQNRYIIVAYPNNERLETGALAILKQIADAMQFGTGVVDPSGLYGKSKFGTPSYVIISHSTGGLATDVALTAAKVHPNLGVGFVADYCKARIASQSAFLGSRYATVVVAAAYQLPIMGNLKNSVYQALGIPNFPSNVINRSVLIDLVPLVAQNRWGPYAAQLKIPTLTIAAAHPTFAGEDTSLLAPLKWTLHRGFDDGVVTINSQVGNPSPILLAPSGFNPKPANLRLFDMGLYKNGQLLRAYGYYIDQVIDPKLNVLRSGVVAGTATPYISPTGMLQPVSNGLSNNSPETIRRYPNHFSYLLTTADHYTGTHDKQGTLTPIFNSDHYIDSNGQRNIEETRVITDPAVFNSYTPNSGYANDNQPLLRPQNLPNLVEIVRGRRVKFKIKIGPLKKEKSWWIWKRTYHLLENYETKVQFDYIYQSVLKN